MGKFVKIDKKALTSGQHYSFIRAFNNVAVNDDITKEGWLLPRVNDSMIFRGWTINVEYFSEVLHTMRIQNTYSLLFDKITKFEEKADVRDSKAIKRMATAYIKLLFPHWDKEEEVDKEAFDLYCLQPALHRRGIVKEQCHYIDSEFKARMPEVWVV